MSKERSAAKSTRRAFGASFADAATFLLGAIFALGLAACSGGGSAPPPAPPAPAGTLALFAGAVVDSGSIDAQGSAARFDRPFAVAVHPASGVAYVADQGNSTVRQVTPSGVVTTLAGTPGQRGFVDGTGPVARFGTLTAIAVDANGVVYVADGDNFAIRRIDAAGRVTTLAGTGQRGFADGVGTSASFYNPTSLAVDASFNVYVGDEYVIRKITPTGVVTTVAGRFGQLGLADGPGPSALLASATFGLAADRLGNVYILEGARLRKLSTDGIVSTLVEGEPRVILNPTGLAIDGADNLYIADSATHAIVKVSPQGQLLSPPVAGTGQGGVDDGPRATATIRGPAIAISQGRLVMAEPFDNVIRQVDLASGTVSTLAGKAAANELSGIVDGIGPAARFAQINQLVADSLGNLYVDDNARIRRITPSAQVTLFSSAFIGSVNALAAGVAGNLYVAQGLFCSDPGVHNLYPCGMKLHVVGPSAATGLLREFTDRLVPSALARDSAGDLYVAVRDFTLQVPAPFFTAYILKVPGSGIFSPRGANGLAFDAASGSLYATDATNHVVVRIAPSGEASVIAGKIGESGNADGIGDGARFHSPTGLTIDSAGNLYVADTGNDLVRKITPQGVVSTVAGTRGSRGFIPGALPSVLKTPLGVAIVGTDLYIAMPTAIAVVHNRP
jgi:sugar lactone lactonase YvrE